jgi:hypothetical protein
MKAHWSYRVCVICGIAVGSGLAMQLTAYAQSTYFTEYNKTVLRLGAQEAIYYVGFVEPLTQTCQWGNVYVASDRKGLYTQLLAAKLAGKRISRVDYRQPGGNGTQCFAELIEFTE